MSRLSKLMGEPIEVKIGEEIFQMCPLKLKELGLILGASSQDQEKQAVALKNIIHKTLKNSIPDATDEEIDNIGMKYFQELTEAIIKVNGLEDVKVSGQNILTAK